MKKMALSFFLFFELLMADNLIENIGNPLGYGEIIRNIKNNSLENIVSVACEEVPKVSNVCSLFNNIANLMQNLQNNFGIGGCKISSAVDTECLQSFMNSLCNDSDPSITKVKEYSKSPATSTYYSYITNGDNVDFENIEVAGDEEVVDVVFNNKGENYYEGFSGANLESCYISGDNVKDCIKEREEFYFENRTEFEKAIVNEEKTLSKDYMSPSASLVMENQFYNKEKPIAYQEQSLSGMKEDLNEVQKNSGSVRKNLVNIKSGAFFKDVYYASTKKKDVFVSNKIKEKMSVSGQFEEKYVKKAIRKEGELAIVSIPEKEKKEGEEALSKNMEKRYSFFLPFPLGKFKNDYEKAKELVAGLQ